MTGVSTDRLNPRSSILTDTIGYDASNSSGDPAFVSSYFNQLETAAVLDEGGNFISLRYQPLYQTAGDYHLGSSCSVAVDTGLFSSVVVDIDGELRDVTPDIGADEFNPGVMAVYPNLTLLAPDGGEMLPGGSIFVVRWGAPAGNMTFDLSYNLGSGTPWQSVASGVTGNCYRWVVPGDIRNVTTARFAVTSRDQDNGGVIAESVISAAPFAIDVIALQTPNGGEIIVSGTTYSILWTERYAPAATQAALWFQEDVGLPWQPLGTVSSGGRYDWAIPNLSTALLTARIGLFIYDGSGTVLLSDVSDAPFTLAASAVVAATAATATVETVGVIPYASVATVQAKSPGVAFLAVVSPEATVAFLSPAGGEVYVSGEVIPVMWDAVAADQIAEVSLWFRVDAESVWSKMASQAIDAGFVEWTIPEVQQRSDSGQLEVRRLDTNGQIIDRVSSERFSVEPGQQVK